MARRQYGTQRRCTSFIGRVTFIFTNGNALVSLAMQRVIFLDSAQDRPGCQQYEYHGWHLTVDTFRLIARHDKETLRYLGADERNFISK